MIKRKESEVLAPYTRTKKLQNMKVTVIPIVSAALGTIPQGLVKRLEDLEIEGCAETIQTAMVSQNTEKFPGDFRRLEETCCHPKSSEKRSANAGVKTLKGKIKLLIIKKDELERPITTLST